MAFGVVWAFAIALEMAAVDVADRILWYKLQSFCQLPTATAGLCFALEYAGRLSAELITFNPAG